MVSTLVKHFRKIDFTLIVLMMGLLVSCDSDSKGTIVASVDSIEQPLPTVNNSNIRVNNQLNEKSKSGFLLVDMSSLISNKGILNLIAPVSGDTLLTVSDEFIMYENDTCFYTERACEHLLDAYVINLEYELFIFEKVKKVEGGYEFILNEKLLSIKDDSYLWFETIEEHYSNGSQIYLTDSMALRINPSQAAEVIPALQDTSMQLGVMDYIFEVIEFNGDWAHLKSSEEFEKPISGWIKWRQEESIFIKAIYIY